MAKYSNGGKDIIRIVASSVDWGCKYCKQKGGPPELEKWIQEIKI
jgi:hypothetical protein